MPRRLPERCLPHCINEFRAAALQRHRDALALVDAGRRTGAVYLWGYVAEMVLKSAIFHAWGYQRDETIDLNDVHAARQLAPFVGLRWTGSSHNVAAWGELLVRFRASFPGVAYPSANFGVQVVAQTRALYQTWRESLRYRKNLAYSFEVQSVRSVVEWLLDHMTVL